MVNYLKANLNDTDIVAAGNNGDSFWDDVSLSAARLWMWLYSRWV